MPDTQTLLFLFLAIVLIVINGFFVAAEFALVKIRPARLSKLAEEGKPFGETALWLAERMDKTLSACQLGITMASLALGWVGEPAFAKLVEPLLHMMGVTNESVIHIAGFATSFAVITGLHLVVGEQFPKIFAIRRPEPMFLACAAPMKFSYYLLFPFLWVLDRITAALLRLVGITGAGGHGDGPATQDEIMQLIAQSYVHGGLTRSEHSLINGVFEFDDLITRQVMLPRGDVDFMEVDASLEACLDVFRRTMHTRYPVCESSLDRVLGIAHAKDLLAFQGDPAEFNLRAVMRPPKKVPETLPISRVLRHFQATRQLMALVVDEHGTNVGIVTLENVLERIIGEVEDEFDLESPHVVPTGPGEYLVEGGTSLAEARRETSLPLEATDSDTVAGLVVERLQRIPSAGDAVELDGCVAEVLEVKNDHATRVKLRVGVKAGAAEETSHG